MTSHAMPHLTAAPTVALDDLQRIVGSEYARDATADDAIDGVPPRFIAAPGDVQQVSALLRLASRAGLAVAPRGGGTALGLGNPPARLDLILDTRRLSRMLEHAAGDLVVRVEAGATLTAVQRAVAVAGQTLALDPPEAERGATIGGIIAADLSGPRRLRYGTVRDLLIGITVVLADGTVATSGGKVVKNVAGYDLGKLFARSLGTLGVVVEAIFRLHPLPAAAGAAVVDLERAAAVGAAVRDVLRSPLVPSALELRWSEGRGFLAALFESVAPGVEAQCERAVALLSPHGEGGAARVVAEEEAADLWAALAERPWQGHGTAESGQTQHGTAEHDGTLGLKLAYPLAELPRILDDVTDLATRHGLTSRLHAHAGTGVAYISFSGAPDGDDVETHAAIVTALRKQALALGGSLVIMRGGAVLKRMVDAWGAVGDAQPLMARIKGEFDPDGVLNPGRFVGSL